MKPASKYVTYITVLAITISLFGLFQAEPGADETRGEIVSGRNLTDAAGKKVGLWVEENGSIEVYYKDGLRDGVFRSYERDIGRLITFGEFKNGNAVGTWYYFDREGYLSWIEKEIGLNPGLTAKGADGSIIVPKFKSHMIDYYPNGVTKAEGIALYFESSVLHFYKKGIWKYYDPSGKLIKTENHN
jgi:antitoxin component YwqK of YwqJK toxin-antitoxin module